ncbi:MAG TPA: asparagine synthase (glutamine-hydrolyzing) [Myxococcota bacterium]
MCGIAGVLFHPDHDGHAPRRDRPAPALAHTLRERLAHRGPDGHGVFVDDGVALVHTRLALVDRAGGAQPMATPDGRFVLVVNGELYGHRQERARLEGRGAVFRTRSDAEVLLWTLALTLDSGADACARALARLEGEFAFCLWDRRSRSALLGRDRLGVKPLVVAHDRGALWFASEAQALCAVLPKLCWLDDVIVARTFAAPQLSGEDVPFRALRALPPGSIAIVAASTTGADADVRTTLIPPPSAPQLAIADALEIAVRERLDADADVEVGAFLSGGLDSSAIVAASLRTRSRMRCYSLRFDEPAGALAGSIVVGDDAPFSEMLARAWPIDLVRVHAHRAALADDLDALTTSQDRMVAWEQELSQRMLARAAQRDVRAVLVGDAADETHHGYAFALAGDASVRALLDRFGFATRLRLLRPALRALVAGDELLDAMPDLRERRRAMARLLRARWLPRLLHNGDLHTMAFGVEARVPFADARVVVAADAVDIDDAFRDPPRDPARGPEKSALRDAVAPWLPPAIVARRKSALPRDDGIGPLWRACVGAILVEGERVERLATVLDVDAVRSYANDDAAIDDERRAILFSILCVDGFLRHHGPR